MRLFSWLCKRRMKGETMQSAIEILRNLGTTPPAPRSPRAENEPKNHEKKAISPFNPLGQKPALNRRDAEALIDLHAKLHFAINELSPHIDNLRKMQIDPAHLSLALNFLNSYIYFLPEILHDQKNAHVTKYAAGRGGVHG